MTSRSDFSAETLAEAQARFRHARLGLLAMVASFLLFVVLALYGLAALAADPLEIPPMAKAKESVPPAAGKTAPKKSRGGGASTQTGSGAALPPVGARVWVVAELSPYQWTRGYVEAIVPDEPLGLVVKVNLDQIGNRLFSPAQVQVLP
jgi:hypothetical protein